MKRTVYIETSVVSYYVGCPSRDVVIAGRQQSTQEFWLRLSGKLTPFVSVLVINEAAKGDSEQAHRRLDAVSGFSVLPVTVEAEQLAAMLLKARAIPGEYPEDALHIAVAASAGMDFIATWNFSHMNNPFTKALIRQTVENAGYVYPEIVSPDAFLEEDS